MGPVCVDFLPGFDSGSNTGSVPQSVQFSYVHFTDDARRYPMGRSTVSHCLLRMLRENSVTEKTDIVITAFS